MQTVRRKYMASYKGPVCVHLSLHSVRADVDVAVSVECAKRWGYALDPGLSHTPWTEEQDERLVHAINEHGHNWTKISSTTFQDRSTVNIKNRYFVLKRQQQSKSSSTRLAFPVEDENLSELSWSDCNDQNYYANGTTFDAEQSEKFENDHVSESPVSKQRMLDHDMGSPFSTTPLELGECFNFSDSLLAPYENDMSTYPIGDSNIEYLHSSQNLDPTLTVDHPADSGGCASSQVQTVTRTATGKPNDIGDGSCYLTDRSTTVEAGGAETESRSRLSTLTLENIHPQTINLVLNTLLSSNASFQMRLDNN
ncbi:MAG: hypothetical protein Q9213_004010 [Squamulea squamosa]